LSRIRISIEYATAGQLTSATSSWAWSWCQDIEISAVSGERYDGLSLLFSPLFNHDGWSDIHFGVPWNIPISWQDVLKSYEKKHFKYVPTLADYVRDRKHRIKDTIVRKINDRRQKFIFIFNNVVEHK
jgi:hypothetical protein